MFVDYFSPFSPCCDSVIVDDGCLSTVGNNSSEYYICENTLLNETVDVSTPGSSYVPVLDSGSSGNTSVPWSDFVVSMDNHGSIEYERMFSEIGTGEGSVGVAESTIPVKSENVKT